MRGDLLSSPDDSIYRPRPPPVKANGLGFMDPELVATTARTVATYMAVKTLPPVEKMFTNQFVGAVQLTDAEWEGLEQRSEKYLPRRKAS